MSTAFKISERLFGSQLNLCGIVIPVCESTAARLFYFVGFILNLIMSLIAVNFGSSISNSVDDGECKSEDCFNRMAVLRICLSGFLFHFALGIVFVIMRYPSETRMAIQNEWWSVKAVIWGALFWFSTQLPLAVIQFFGRISLVGSGFAILMQSILLIDLAYYWNDIWIQTNRLKRLLMVSGILFLANLTLTIILFVYYTGPSCIENTFFITISLIEWLVFSALSIYGNRGVLPGTLMGFCCISLCFSAILSEPYRKNLHRCNRLGIDNSSFIALTLLSMNIAALGYCNVKIPTPKDISTETVQEDEEDEQTWNLVCGDSLYIMLDSKLFFFIFL
eukprot:TRINITY_DN8059_c0_g1_i2.p1 TRINITY_DN8059_c0_g1~~TRINITY_DN8059_c0_g1_i2.p1  ORF type:complete len:335 (+),score=42.87 TRINITY_DN8059_c0_g1_i2:52-1056(+)